MKSPFKLFPHLIAWGVIICAVLFIYSPTLQYGILDWDDDYFITKNSSIKNLGAENIKEIFQDSILDTYVPLTSLSFAIEYHFFKHNPFVYHLDNLLLYLIIVTLIFILALRLGLNLFAAACAALVFAVHPTHVESVVWLTERKDVLYAVFYLLALISYWNFLGGKKKLNYGLALFFGLLSILAKAMALSLPLVLFLFDWLKDKKIRPSMILNKIPFFLYIIPIALVTYVQNARIPGQSIWESTLIWIWTFSFYIQKFFLPVNLSSLYFLPQPINLMQWDYFIAVSIFIIIMFLLIRYRRNSWLWLGFGFYFLSMFFIFRFDYKVDLSIVANRFSFLASTGCCLALGRGIDVVLKRLWKARKENLVLGLGCLLLVNIGMWINLTVAQTKNWKDPVTLYTSIINDYPDLSKVSRFMATIYNNRCSIYCDNKKFNKARGDCETAIKISPQYWRAYNNLGNIYKNLNEYDLGIKSFNKAVELKPNQGDILRNRAHLYIINGRREEALADLNKVLLLNPEDANTYVSRGNFYSEMQQYALALADYNKAVMIDPEFFDAYLNRARQFILTKDFSRALEDINKALDLDAASFDAYNIKATVFLYQNDYDQALEYLNKSLDLNPQYAPALQNKSKLLEVMKNQ